MHSFYPISLVDADRLISSNVSTPFYYTDGQRWHPYISDKGLALLTPVITYWFMFFLYRLFLFIHSPQRPRPPCKAKTVRMIVEIQLVQTLFGWVWLTRNGKPPSDLVGDMRAIARVIATLSTGLIGEPHTEEFLNRNGKELVHFAYWWAVPVARQFFASLTIDAWQTFLRFLHVDYYLYADVHAFLFDTVGVCLAYSLSGLTNRETALFLMLSTLQTLGKRPRPILPASSIHPHIPVRLEDAAKQKRDVPFMGFRRQLRQLAQWYFLTLDMQSVESRRIQQALRVARHQQATGRERTRPQLRLDTSCL